MSRYHCEYDRASKKKKILSQACLFIFLLILSC